MNKKILYTIDVEKDLHTPTYRGITEGLIAFEKICDQYRIKPILFVTGDSLQAHPAIFKRLHSKGWEIGSHGFSHKRFDDLSYQEKEMEIKRTKALFKNKLHTNPRWFRAPQHSIDNATLDLLEKHGFSYDSSYTPLNFPQLLFFPKRLLQWVRLFLSPLQEYRIRESLHEVPCSAFLIPFISLTVRVAPKWFLKLYASFIKVLYRQPVFYAHSWDFISLPESRIDKLFNHHQFIQKLKEMMAYA